MLKPSLEGVRAKIDRAREQFEELKLVLSEHDRTNPTKLRMTQLNSEGKTIIASVQHLPEVPLKVRILIGEVVHSLAGALDNLVFQLSLSHQIAIGNIRAFEDCDRAKTYFPVFIEPDKRVDNRLRLMAPAPAKLIRGMQPYEIRPDSPTTHPLWAMYQLDIIDKHRVVLAVAHAASPNEITITAPGKQIQAILKISDAPWQRLEPGMELFRIEIIGGDLPDADTSFKVDAGKRILFAQTGLLDGDNVLYVLKELIPFIESSVVDVLAPHVV